MNKNLEIALYYYKGWETGNKDLLKISPELKHTGSGAEYNSAEEFLNACWQYAGAAMQNKQFVSEGNKICISYEMVSGSGPKMYICEWLTIEDEMIKEIRVYFGNK